MTVDPVARALHRLVAGGGYDRARVSPAALAQAAHRAEVAVLAANLAPELAPHLAPVLERQRRFDALLELALLDVAPALSGEPVALAKGTASAAWCYRDGAERARKDLDLLVGDALPDVRNRLLARGWRDHLDPRASRDLQHARAWPMAKELGRATLGLDLHRALVHGDWCRPDVAAMIAAAVPGRAALPITSPADTLVHTAIHLTGSGFHEPLKGWVDLARLAPLVPPAELAARARLHRARTVTWLGLGVVQRWFAVDSPELAPTIAAHRAALGAPPHGRVLDWLLAGEHATPERRPAPRGLAYRFWRLAARDV